MADILSCIPKMLTNADLIKALAVYPDYDDSIRAEDDATRLLALDDIYRIYHPSVLSVEVYNKMYMSLVHSLKQRNDTQNITGFAGERMPFLFLPTLASAKALPWLEQLL